MRVTTGTTCEGRTIEVTLDDDDGRLAEGSEEWAVMSVADRFRVLARDADELVIYYLCKEHLISKEYAQQRIREIRGE